MAEELYLWKDPDGQKWSKNLQPLTDVIVSQYLSFWPKQNYPIRSGLHTNTAFGLALAIDYARAVGNQRLLNLVSERSLTYFGTDENYSAVWEPGGEDFLSPALTEADLIRRIMKPADFHF